MENISVLNVIVKDLSKNFLWISERLEIKISVGFNSNAKKYIRFQNKYMKNNTVLSCHKNNIYLYIIKKSNDAKEIAL